MDAQLLLAKLLMASDVSVSWFAFDHLLLLAAALQLLKGHTYSMLCNCWWTYAQQQNKESYYMKSGLL
jgi:hypothetical protein